MSHDTTAYPSSPNHNSDGLSLNVKSVHLVLRIAELTAKVCQDMLALTRSSGIHNVAVNAANASQGTTATAAGVRAGGSSTVYARVGGSGSGKVEEKALFCYHTTGLLHYAVYVRSRPLVELFLRPPWYEQTDHHIIACCMYRANNNDCV